MADVLSQSEVESLLAALDGSKGAGPSAPAPRRAEASWGTISVYDFKRPERVSKEQMRAFQALHDGFSREFGAGLSSILRTIVEVKLISVDQLTYSEFVFGLENPTCFNLLHSGGLEGHMILELNPAIIFPIVDRLLGGGRDARNAPHSRALTEIEKRLVSRVTLLAVKGLENAWSSLCQLKLEATRVESNPQLVQIVPPNEVIVRIRFEIALGEIRGIMNLCIPFNTIEPLAGKLSSDSWSADTGRAAEPRPSLSLETSLSQAKVEVIVQLARARLTASEVRALAVGDVIMTEHATAAGLTLQVENQPLFVGFPGLYTGHKAVRIGRSIQRPQDLFGQKLAVRSGADGANRPTP